VVVIHYEEAIYPVYAPLIVFITSGVHVITGS